MLDGARLVEVNRFFTDVARRGEFWSEQLAEELKDKGSVKEFAQVPPEVKALFPVAHDIDAGVACAHAVSVSASHRQRSIQDHQLR